MADDIEALRQEVTHLSAETLALQVLLSTLLLGLRRSPVIPGGTIERVFNGAADATEELAIRFGRKAHSAHTVGALGIIEQLRAQVFHGE